MLNETFNVAADDFSESTGRFGDYTKYLRCDVYVLSSLLLPSNSGIQCSLAFLSNLNEPSVHYVCSV